MLVAMPSSGSTWLADCIVKTNPQLLRPPVKEFFNPIVNIDLYDELSSLFGCETTDSYRHVAAPVTPARRDRLEQLLRRVWDPSWKFTKEVWVGYQVSMLREYFALVGLVRDDENTLPPTRLRVWQWYGAIHDSVRENLGIEAHGSHLRDKALVGHLHLKRQILSTVPTLRWEQLVHGSLAEVAAECTPLSRYVDPEALAQTIVATRVQRSIPVYAPTYPGPRA